MEEVAGYRLTERLAARGMSEVWLGFASDGRRAAVKLLDPAIAARPAMRARIDAASPLLAAFDHPRSVRLLDWGEQGRRRFAIVDWSDGTNLRAAVRGGLDPVRVAAIVSEVAEALDALDLAGITYADTKTGNVLVDEEHAVLAHSWLAFPRDGDRDAFRDPERFAGTIDYVAPEVIGGELPDLRSDVYGLGCLAFECLTGQVPFPRDTEDATLDAHLHEPPPATGSARIDRSLARALAKDPETRSPTAGSFAADLAAAAGA